MIFNQLFDPMLRPLLFLGDFWAMVALSFLVSLLITVIYKYVTDQKMMKDLKEEIKKLQKNAKEQKKDPSKMMAIQKQMMEKNMVLMKHSMKPTLITFIPLILIIGWLQANLAFDPIAPGSEFSVLLETEKDFSGVITFQDTPGVTLIGEKNKSVANRAAEFKFTAEEGSHSLQFYANTGTEVSVGTAPVSFTVDAKISNGKEYGQQTQKLKTGGIQQAMVNYPKKIIFDLGFMRFGWLGTYIIFSLVFSIALRKVLKVY